MTEPECMGCDKPLAAGEPGQQFCDACTEQMVNEAQLAMNKDALRRYAEVSTNLCMDRLELLRGGRWQWIWRVSADFASIEAAIGFQRALEAASASRAESRGSIPPGGPAIGPQGGAPK